MRTRIALSGLAGHGKSTLAGALVANHGFSRRALADALKENIGQLMKDLTGQAAIDWVNQNKSRLRVLLQEYGTSTRDLVGDSVWINKVLQHIQHLELYEGKYKFVVDDVRFPNEVATFERHGFFVVRVVRPEAKGLAGAAALHSSEVSLNGSEAKLVIVNDGTLEDLADAAGLLVHGDIPLTPQYHYSCALGEFFVKHN